MYIVHKGMAYWHVITLLEAIVPRRSQVSHSVDLISLSWRLIKHRKRVCLWSNKSILIGLQVMVVECICCLALIFFLLLFLFLGGFTYLHCSRDERRVCSTRLSSPLISSGAKLKCLQFWLYGWSSFLKVSLASKYKEKAFLFRAYPCWRQRRVAVSEDFPYQVNDII